MKKQFVCNECKRSVIIAGTVGQWYDFFNCSKNIQDIFPEVPEDDREIMLSGLCGQCFDKLFS